MICLQKNLLWYREILSRNNIKNTKQKEKILLELMQSSSHLMAEEIYQRVKNDKIGIATVYRSLKLFERLGIVKEFPMDGVKYYELKIYSKKPLHIHFKCSKCNVIIDIDDADINIDYIKLNQKVEMKRELEVNDVNITLLGLCKKCREELRGKTN